MNKDNARDYLPLVQALAEGKTLQFMSDGGSWVDQFNVDGEIYFTNDSSRYRIKPEPKKQSYRVALVKTQAETFYTLEQEAKQARDDMREVMLEEFGIGATLSDRILSLMIRAVQSNIAHNDAKYEVSGDGSGESLPEVSQEERDSDGWIEWGGGYCPVGYHEYVSVKNRDGSICKEWQAGNLRWEYAGKNAMLNPAYDIIAYRIVK